MKAPKDRLKYARLKAGYKTPADAARSVRELNKNTLTSHENGNRELSRQAAEKYGRIFGVTPGWLLYGDNVIDNEIISEIIELLRNANDQQRKALLNMIRSFLRPITD